MRSLIIEQVWRPTKNRVDRLMTSPLTANDHDSRRHLHTRKGLDEGTSRPGAIPERMVSEGARGRASEAEAPIEQPVELAIPPVHGSRGTEKLGQ